MYIMRVCSMKCVFESETQDLTCMQQSEGCHPLTLLIHPHHTHIDRKAAFICVGDGIELHKARAVVLWSVWDDSG